MTSAEVHRLAGDADQGVAWGVPWPRGEVAPGSSFSLGDVPVQSWPLATWPDGSWKWTAHAAAGLPTERATLTVGDGSAPVEHPVRVSDDGTLVETGRFRFHLGGVGDHALIRSIEVDGRPVGGPVDLVSLWQRGQDDDVDRPARTETVARVHAVTVEQAGPVRAVVRFTTRGAVTVDVRAYFTAGSGEVRLVHTLVFDPEPGLVLAGLGVRAGVPLADAAERDRHVRIGGPVTDFGPGFLTEAVRPLTGQRRDPGPSVRAAQVAGQACPPLPPSVASLERWIPTWDAWRLQQHSPDGFTLAKRTGRGQGWVTIPGATRASGYAYLGSVGGGLGLGLRDFWKLYPTRIDVDGATAATGRITVWLWSPSAPAMDVRPYHDGLGTDGWADELDALNITYEDYEPGFNDPHGIARTHELRLFAHPATPDAAGLVSDVTHLTDPAVVAPTPRYLADVGVFGDWSPVDRSGVARTRLEDRIDLLVDFYRGQVDDRRWYGFWDYGDVMHAYDADRHQWRYDVGGFAWDNSELSPDLWLWYQFLRSGSPDVFRLAEAMTRHTGEVDVYHTGRFAGLGSRHNVQHWGCSAKQVRISSAAYRRIPYYLTADERIGDLLREVAHVERTFERLDPNRKVRSDHYVMDRHAVSIGLGTDWSALAAAWLTTWERVGDESERLEAAAKLLGTMADIAALPQGFLTGEARFDLDIGRFDTDHDQILNSHLAAVFGLIETVSELIRLTEHTDQEVPGFADAWARYGRLYLADDQEQIAELGARLPGVSLVQGYSRLLAWVAARTGSDALARRAWDAFEDGADRYNHNVLQHTADWDVRVVAGPTVLAPVREAAWVSTNDAAQYGLAAIQNLALIAGLRGLNSAPSPS